MIEITNVSKSYNGSTYAVKDLSLSVPSGEIFGFLGPNGAGKSTTIKMITGIHGVDKGTITINGKKYYGRSDGSEEDVWLCAG